MEESVAGLIPRELIGAVIQALLFALAPLAVSDGETRRILAWMESAKRIPVKATCCPSGPTGCLGGRGFAFLSHTGTLQTCGFVETPCGSVRDHGFDFRLTVAAAENPLGASGNCRGRTAPR